MIVRELILELPVLERRREKNEVAKCLLALSGKGCDGNGELGQANAMSSSSCNQSDKTKNVDNVNVISIVPNVEKCNEAELERCTSIHVIDDLLKKRNLVFDPNTMDYVRKKDDSTSGTTSLIQEKCTPVIPSSQKSIPPTQGSSSSA